MLPQRSFKTFLAKKKGGFCCVHITPPWRDRADVVSRDTVNDAVHDTVHDNARDTLGNTGNVSNPWRLELWSPSSLSRSGERVTSGEDLPQLLLLLHLLPDGVPKTT